MPPSSPNVPCSVENTTWRLASNPAGSASASIRKSCVGNERESASAHARPEPSETSRSPDVPPAKTAMMGKGVLMKERREPPRDGEAPDSKLQPPLKLQTSIY